MTGRGDSGGDATLPGAGKPTPTHASLEALAEIAAGMVPSPSLASHLVECGACRAALVALDPTALFLLLPALPAALPEVPYPGLPAGVGRSGAAVAPHRAEGIAARWGLAAAAVLLVSAFLFSLFRPGPTSAYTFPVSARQAATSAVEVVPHPEARGQVVTLVPDGDGPTVVLILDAGFDL